MIYTTMPEVVISSSLYFVQREHVQLPIPEKLSQGNGTGYMTQAAPAEKTLLEPSTHVLQNFL